MAISTTDERYTIRGLGPKLTIHDEGDLLEPGRKMAECGTEIDALKIVHALNKQYSIAIQLCPARLRKVKVGVA